MPSRPGRVRVPLAWVGTCPAKFWEEWLREGDCAGDPPSSEPDGYAWWTRAQSARHIKEGDRFYVLARGLIRGYAVVSSVRTTDGEWWQIRRVNPVAVSIPERVRGFQGIRRRWWNPADEVPFPDWRTAKDPPHA